MKQRAGNISVLYVEDDADTREAVLYFLRKRFDRVYAAADGFQGYGMFLETSPDIVVGDVLMPASDGLTMASRILAVAPYAAIIITSAHNEPAMKKRAEEIGILHYVVKPCSLEELESALQQCMEGLGRSGTGTGHACGDPGAWGPEGGRHEG